MEIEWRFINQELDFLGLNLRFNQLNLRVSVIQYLIITIYGEHVGKP